jgi:hypothetical protein
MAKREGVIVEASARILTSRFHTTLPFEKAKDMIERNRGLGKPMLYAGANYDIPDFLATGCKTGVFIDKSYSDTIFPDRIPSRDGYLESFQRSLTDIDDATSVAIKGPAELGRSDGWKLAFSFCGEERSVICYGKSIRSIEDETIPSVLASGVVHYTTVHYPTEWGIIFVLPSIIGLVVPGGHLETWCPKALVPMLDSFDFSPLHANPTNEVFEKRCGRIYHNGVSVYERLGKYTLFEKDLSARHYYRFMSNQQVEQ